MTGWVIVAEVILIVIVYRLLVKIERGSKT